MPCTKTKTIPRKIAALTEGMISMVIDESKNQRVIVLVGMDVPTLATKLRKKVGCTTIISIEEVKSEEEEEAKEEGRRWQEEEAERKKEEEDESAKKQS